MAYYSQGNHTKFGNRMNYIKEKTEPYLSRPDFG